MDLFFETYLIITLLFALLVIYIAGIFFKGKTHTMQLGILVIILGFVIPYFLILFQKGYGSLGEIDRLIFLDGRTEEEILEELRHTFITDRPLIYIVFDYFTHNLVFIVLSIAIGIALGILVHLRLKRRKTDETRPFQ